MRIDSNSNINYNNTSTQSNNQSKINLQKEDINIENKKMEVKSQREEKTIVIEDLYSKQDIMDLIEEANEEFVTYDRKFEFGIHEKTKQITVKVLDSVTDEVIRELPPEKILDMLAGLWEVAGILIDESI